jgi:hypothetical protein
MSSDATPEPPEKPVAAIPETGADANSMARLLSNSAQLLKNSNNAVTASALDPATPYGGGHNMALLGEGKAHGAR